MTLAAMDKAAASALFEQVKQQYADLKAQDLHLDLTRGKPAAAQLDISNSLMQLPSSYRDEAGTDCRNYGGLAGITDIRKIYAELLGVPVAQVYAADGSSLNIMFDVISFATLWGTADSPRPWGQEEKVKWLCPVPGYDRHFAITEHFGFEMLPVPMTPAGPDMSVVAELVKDPAVKGMWNVPMFGNPTGITYSEDVCRQLAALETAAPDFRIIWDNAYAIHTLDGNFPEIIDVLGLAAAAGNPNRFLVFTSTSKITFAGSGVSFFAASPENLAWYSSHAGIRGIGPNKMNQLAHAQYFGDVAGLKKVMLAHAEILQPKFARVLEIMEERLGAYGIATWTHPTGGYFISLDVVDGTASRVVQLAKEAGIALTAAGSSFPLKHDPNNRNIRLAPSLPPVAELEAAMDGVATCVLYAALEAQLG